MSREPKVIPVGRLSNVLIKVSRHLIDDAVQHLLEDGETFIANIDAAQAYRCKKRIMRQLDGEAGSLKTYPAEGEDSETRRKCDGYIFRLVKSS